MAMTKIRAGWTCAVLLVPLALPAQGQERSVEVLGPVPATVTGNLRDLPRSPPWQPGDPIKDIPAARASRPRCPRRRRWWTRCSGSRPGRPSRPRTAPSSCRS